MYRAEAYAAFLIARCYPLLQHADQASRLLICVHARSSYRLASHLYGHRWPFRIAVNRQ
jgi:hypothetical protein